MNGLLFRDSRSQLYENTLNLTPRLAAGLCEIEGPEIALVRKRLVRSAAYFFVSIPNFLLLLVFKSELEKIQRFEIILFSKADFSLFTNCCGYTKLLWIIL